MLTVEEPDAAQRAEFTELVTWLSETRVSPDRVALAVDIADVAAVGERVDERPERAAPLATHDGVDLGHVEVVRHDGGVVAADHDEGVGPRRAHHPRERLDRARLVGVAGEADDVVAEVGATTTASGPSSIGTGASPGRGGSK